MRKLKILTGFGHDAAIYNKNTFTKKSWTGPSGEIAILPQEDGPGLMMSTLQSREFGFGFRNLLETELAQINISPVGKKYIDGAAARKIKGSAVKPLLCIDENLFIQYFEYGANNEGYWPYDHLVVQVEECFDILKVLYPTDKYEIQIMVDHSCGHDRQREDGLNIETMNKSYGGSQRVIHSSIMKEGCLGSHAPLLQIGDTQEMVFDENDDSPFYMPEDERQKLKEGDLESSKYVTIGKAILLRKLFAIGDWTDNEVLTVCGDKFTVNTSKKTLFAEMKYLQPRMLRQLCEKKGIHVNERVSYDSLVQKLLSGIDANIDTIKFGNRKIELDRE